MREVARKRDRELLVLLHMAALRNLEGSRRFGGRICGYECSFDGAARATLSQFEIWSVCRYAFVSRDACAIHCTFAGVELGAS